MDSDQRVRVTFDTFFTGLLAGLVLRGRRAVSIRGSRFDEIVVCLANELEAEHADLDLRFHLEPHYIHGYSETVRDGIVAATQADIVSLDNPEYQDIRFKIDREDADELLDGLPLERTVFLNLADHFLKAYDETSRPSGSPAT
jgi:hypothetical protein